MLPVSHGGLFGLYLVICYETPAAQKLPQSPHRAAERLPVDPLERDPAQFPQYPVHRLLHARLPLKRHTGEFDHALIGKAGQDGLRVAGFHGVVK